MTKHLNYTFTVTNKSKEASAYQLSMVPAATTFDSDYQVTYSSVTDPVEAGGEAQVNVRVHVPAEAVQGERKYGTLKIASTTDGSEATVKLQTNVVTNWASSADALPNLMVTKDQLAQAKSKVTRFAWAKDYLTAVVKKADVWLDTVVNVPDRP